MTGPWIEVCCVLFVVFVFAVILGSITRSMRKDARQRDAFMSAFANDPKYAASPSRSTIGVSVWTRVPRPAGELRSSGYGKNQAAPCWLAYATAPRVAVRTSLAIEREAVFAGLREKFGRHDIHSGDAHFDRRFLVRGSNDDVVRGLLLVPAVRSAIDHLFSDGGVRSFTIDGRGSVEAWAPRDEYAAPQAREVLDRTLALVVALEANADAPSALPPSSTTGLAEGATAASGAPVAVPVAVVGRSRR